MHFQCGNKHFLSPPARPIRRERQCQRLEKNSIQKIIRGLFGHNFFFRGNRPESRWRMTLRFHSTLHAPSVGAQYWTHCECFNPGIVMDRQQHCTILQTIWLQLFHLYRIFSVCAFSHSLDSPLNRTHGIAIAKKKNSEFGRLRFSRPLSKAFLLLSCHSMTTRTAHTKNASRVDAFLAATFS